MMDTPDYAAAMMDTPDYDPDPGWFTDLVTCRICGCDDMHACWDDETDTPCWWVRDGLCSVCARAGDARAAEPLPGECQIVMRAAGADV